MRAKHGQTQFDKKTLIQQGIIQLISELPVNRQTTQHVAVALNDSGFGPRCLVRT